MTATFQSLLSDAYLRAVFDQEFLAFTGSDAEKTLLERLEKWSSKYFQKETSAEGAFTNVFLEDTWSYVQSGKHSIGDGFTCFPKFAVSGAGQGGGTGEADAALGHFGRSDIPGTPQVLCEFKDVRSNLDAPQKRKGNNRSPVKQCADYLREAMKPLFGNEAIEPNWGIVTDMNEFRLYWRNTMPSQYQRFIIKKATTDEGVSLLEKTEEASFQRFLFIKLFHADSLLTLGGASPLLKLLKDQRYQEKEIENLFYREYRAYREHLVGILVASNPTFSGTKGRLVRLAQKLIDRCIFVMFCEDMGEQLSFPPNALRDYLAELSKNSTFEPEEHDAWNKLKELFQAMNDGKKFRSRILNKFNGGLFAADAELENLVIPNEAFCVKLQGENASTLGDHRLTLLYFAGSYNFGTVKRNGKAITLFTLGRIFEQSITELEALEAAADQKESLTVISKRKRDGVYYTPEWVVERVVAETLGPRLDDIRKECGWSLELEGDEDEILAQTKLSPSKRSVQFRKHAEAVRKFRDRLETFTVLDPACGSGAFLIHTLEYLLRERRRVERELALVSKEKNAELFEFKPDEAVRSILSRNIFGVDINPASVEIARLALWLHTAKSNQPLTNLDHNIVTGNSLVGPDVYLFKKDLLEAAESKRERLNAFDFRATFKSIFAPGRSGGPGFDCVVGNPPYVKLQNFKRVYPDTAEYLHDAPGTDGHKLYRSCQTGTFDLYLPFIEHGLTLLNDRGRLGFIAPSVWRFNEYGEGLRKLIKEKRALERWIDFGSFQVFNEATTYTALQFYSNFPLDHVQIALAPDGALAGIPDWDDPAWRIDYKEISATEPWIFASRPTLDLIKKLRETCTRLGDQNISESISQGLISGAFDIFSNERVAPGTYRSRAFSARWYSKNDVHKMPNCQPTPRRNAASDARRSGDALYDALAQRDRWHSRAWPK
jgi:SAM-dependent methyltransferase